MRFLSLFLLISFSTNAQNTFPGIGLWREHLPYQGTIDVTASGQKVYAATPSSFFSIDLVSAEIQRFSKVSGLAETGVRALSYDASTEKLYIAYSNSNVDVMDEAGLHNIPDIKRSVIAGDKNIYAVYPDGNHCYLSTGLGIIVLDATRFEVKDSWFIGAGGGYVKVNAFLKSSDFFYAATEQGLKKTSVLTGNPADFSAWQTVSGTAGLALAAAKAAVLFGTKIIVLQNDSLFAENGAGWVPFFSNGKPVTSINVSNNKLLICQPSVSGPAQVVVLDENGTVQKTLQQPNVIVTPQKAVAVGNEFWIADIDGGLSNFSATSFETFKLNSPQGIVLGNMAVRNGVLWAAAGTVNDSWNYQYNPNGIFKLDGGNWSAFNRYTQPSLNSLLDVITVAIDPRDGSAWTGSFGSGMVHINNGGPPAIFKQNSPISETIGDPGSYRVAGLAFDADNNLWISNFGAAKQLLLLKNDGNWQSFNVPFFINENAVAQIVIDNAGQKWIQSPLGNGVLVFSEGDLATTSDDRWKFYRTGAGLGGLPSNDVECLAKDKSGFIWVGTTNGVAVFQCPETALAATTSCDAVLPVIKETGFAAYLFQGQRVRSIAVDGADRKWMATTSGLWLISAGGDKVLANFTEQNSPLLSNDVRQVAIDGTTGEVFVATAKGLCSFRGSATEYEETKNKVLVYPNPVPPDFNGLIGIRGLPENTVVKITELNGRLVYQTRSLGGQAVWNGKDYKGAKASTGVYLVMAVDAVNSEHVAAKIVFIGR